ncbi:MAG: hypothetical protein ACI33P_13030 [Lysinibacillus sp.]
MGKQYVLWALLTAGGLFGIFGQGIAYFLWELFDYGWPLHYLTVITVSSYILLFLVACVSIWKKYRLLLGATLIAGGMISMWSFFVLAMWWG